MRLKILGLAVVLSIGLMATATADGQVPCSAYTCRSTLHATEKVRHWIPKGKAGEKWLLYLNIYAGGKRLAYRRLPGGCEAAYDGQGVSVLLHACGHRSRLDYVAFGGSKRLSVEYHYVAR